MLLELKKSKKDNFVCYFVLMINIKRYCAININMSGGFSGGGFVGGGFEYNLTTESEF